MAKPYSEDLRERIVQAVDAGASRASAARHFLVSVSCVIKLMQRWRRTGSVAAGQMGGWKQPALAPHRDLVDAVLAEQPDLTLDELRDALAQRGVSVGRSSVRRFLISSGITLKKSRCTPPSRIGRTSPQRAMRGAPRNAR
jgi:transposase